MLTHQSLSFLLEISMTEYILVEDLLSVRAGRLFLCSNAVEEIFPELVDPKDHSLPAMLKLTASIYERVSPEELSQLVAKLSPEEKLIQIYWSTFTAWNSVSDEDTGGGFFSSVKELLSCILSYPVPDRDSSQLKLIVKLNVKEAV